MGDINEHITPLFGLYVLTLMVTYVVSIYTNIYVLIPRFLIRKKYSAYLTLLFIMVVFLLLAQYLLDVIFPPIIGMEAYQVYHPEDPLMFLLDVMSTFSVNLMAFVGVSVTVLLKFWIIGNRDLITLEREHLQNELALLKEQISPDFLFLSMRSIGKLENTDVESATLGVYKLSRLLRYQLYDGNRERVFLISEIRYLTDYLELQHINQADLKFEISYSGDFQRTLLPPMIFIPFIQQMIDLPNSEGQTSHLNVNFYVEDDELSFRCIRTGSGFIKPRWENILQRLRILFQKDFSFGEMETRDDGAYGIELTLNLAGGTNG